MRLEAHELKVAINKKDEGKAASCNGAGPIIRTP